MELLTPKRAVFTDDVDVKIKLSGHSTVVVSMDDPSRTVVARITVQPGAWFPWHTHSGPVLVNVVSGSLDYIDASDCVPRQYTEGEAFFDVGGGHVHTASNPSLDTETVLIATFFKATDSGPLTIPVTPPADCVVETSQF